MNHTVTNYNQRFNKLTILVETSKNLSLKTYSLEVDTWEEQIASDYFGTLCAKGHSILKLIPNLNNTAYEKNAVIWDYTSICTLTRNIIDTYLLFYHFCIDIPNDKNEREFKQIFWNYYLNYKRIKNLELINSENKELKKLKSKIELDKDNLLKYQFFLNLPDNLKKKILKCQIFQIPNNEEIAAKAGFSKEFYKSTYDYLSRYTHSDSFCLDQIAIFHAGNDSSIRLISTVLQYMIIFMSFSLRGFTIICKQKDLIVEGLMKEIIENSEFLAKNS